MGSCSASATLWYESSSHAKSRSASRSPSGSASIAPATRGKSTRRIEAPWRSRACPPPRRPPSGRSRAAAGPRRAGASATDSSPSRTATAARSRATRRTSCAARTRSGTARRPALRRLRRPPGGRGSGAGRGVSVVDQPEGLGLVERAADHLGVRRRAHSSPLSRSRGVVRGRGDDYRHARSLDARPLCQVGPRSESSVTGHLAAGVCDNASGETCHDEGERAQRGSAAVTSGVALW